MSPSFLGGSSRRHRRDVTPEGRGQKCINLLLPDRRTTPESCQRHEILMVGCPRSLPGSFVKTLASLFLLSVMPICLIGILHQEPIRTEQNKPTPTAYHLVTIKQSHINRPQPSSSIDKRRGRGNPSHHPESLGGSPPAIPMSRTPTQTSRAANSQLEARSRHSTKTALIYPDSTLNGVIGQVLSEWDYNTITESNSVGIPSCNRTG